MGLGLPFVIYSEQNSGLTCGNSYPELNAFSNYKDHVEYVHWWGKKSLLTAQK